MVSITIPRKEYSKILKIQTELKAKVDWLQEVLEREVQEEFTPEYGKKLDRISVSLDKGSGVRFLNSRSAKQYLKNL